jgi:hypothetical protein
MVLLDDLLVRLRAEPILTDIRVIESESVDDATFHFKVRAIVRFANLQIRSQRRDIYSLFFSTLQ